MQRWTLRRARTCLAPLMVGAAIAMFASSAARAAEPATVFSHGTTNSFIWGWNAYDNQAWWAAQDLHSRMKLMVSFNTTPSNLGIPVTHMLVIGILPNGQETLGVWPAQFSHTTNPPSITSSVGSVTWVPARHAYHLTLNMPGTFTFTPTPGPMTANLWFTGVPGGAAMPTVWDGQTSYLTQTLGAGKVNGTINFPGFAPVSVKNWGADAEPEYGTYLDGTEPNQPANHIGYEWADAQNPDGSADLLLSFAEEDGVWRGMLSHTTARGQVTECEPDVYLGDWTTATDQEPANVTGFYYPQVIHAICKNPRTTKPCLSVEWHMSPAGTQIGPFVAYSFTVAMGWATTTTPGAVAWVQDFREKGSTTPGPSWSSTGLKARCVQYGQPKAKTKKKRRRHRRHKRHHRRKARR
jgi:hypothetical protein